LRTIPALCLQRNGGGWSVARLPVRDWEDEMIGRILYGACAAALVTTTAVIAQPSASETAKADPNKQICRMVGDTGSRLGRFRACHTAQEWIELRRQTKQNIDHIQNARPWNAG